MPPRPPEDAAEIGARAALDVALLKGEVGTPEEQRREWFRVDRVFGTWLDGQVLGAVASDEDPEEILGEVWARAALGIKSFRGRTPAAFATWLSTIAKNALADHRRKAARRRGIVEDNPEALAAPENDEGSETDRLVRRLVLQGEIDPVLERLSPWDRQLLRLSALEGRKPREIAEHLDLESGQSAADELKRVYEEFRRVWAELYPDDPEARDAA